MTRFEADVPPAWERSAQAIERLGSATVLVIGAQDVGKTTYCRFLASRLGEAGHRVDLVDSDVGQKAIGPPTTVTLGEIGAIDLPSDLPPRGFYFVGATTPVGRLLPMLVGVRRMLDGAQAPFALVNTTGLIHGVGRVLKTHKIEALRPDVVVALEAADELRAILRAHRNRNVLRVEPSERAAPKSVEAKRKAREASFSRYFRGAQEVTLPLADVAVQRSLLFTGEAVDDPRFLHAERTAEGVVAVAREGLEPRSDPRVLPAGFERDLLCGVADRRDEGLGLATIRRIDFARREISLLTPVPAERIAVLQLGDLRVAPDGRELGGRSLP
jgi:polynucleotide 5'-hydroxyl-kinase GRC3/NOL9